jgi:hypothetical protein
LWGINTGKMEEEKANEILPKIIVEREKRLKP